MKLSFKTILPILLIFTLLILFAGCFITPDDQPGYTPGTITGIIAAPCCSTSADPVTEPCCVSPEYWCNDCEGNWNLQNGVEVILTYGEDEIATVFTNEDGEYTFTNVAPGKNYVITALCPDYDDDRPLVKDVALEVVEGETYDAKITDCVSTSLGLVVDFLVTYTELGPEEIVLDEVIAGNPNFWSFPRFKELVIEVCRALAECGNLSTDEDVQDALCDAAEEVGQIVIPDLELGCGPGATPGEGEGEGECEDPTAEAGGPYSDTVCPGTENKGILPVALIDLVGSGTGTSTLSWSWDFDNGGSTEDSIEQSPQGVAFGVGTYTVTLKVTDICGSTIDTAEVTITECINTAPKVSTIPRQAISAVSYLGSCIPTYELTVSSYASDDEGNDLSYSFVGAIPAGMTIDENSGKIVWDPVCGNIGLELKCHQCGTVCVTVRVEDNGCCQPSYTDVVICIEVWDGWIDNGDYVGIGFDGCPIDNYFCLP